MNQERTKRKLSGILSADVVGYSRLMGEDEAITSFHRELLKEAGIPEKAGMGIF